MDTSDWPRRGHDVRLLSFLSFLREIHVEILVGQKLKSPLAPTRSRFRLLDHSSGAYYKKKGKEKEKRKREKGGKKKGKKRRKKRGIEQTSSSSLKDFDYAVRTAIFIVLC